MTTLFDPIESRRLELPNRIIMAPLTRSRAVGGGRVPNALMAEYYVQRASAGLILSEATSVTPMGVGYADTPGIWSDEQVEGWKQVTDAVHGRRPHLPAAVARGPHLRSAVPGRRHAGGAKRGQAGRPRQPGASDRDYETRARWTWKRSRASSPPTARAPRTRRRPASTASRSTAPTATCSTSSCRTRPTSAPTYGGSIENRARLMLEVTDACIAVWGADRVGMHLAPRRDCARHGRLDPAGDLRLRRARTGQARHRLHLRARSDRRRQPGPAAEEGIRRRLHRQRKDDKESAEQLLTSGEADAVAFGQWFIANPDLPRA
jgi:2,4-dienoyl-CoA reductase-like NADH-dependent reductase (Old Yellow Enzyme family)